MPKGNRANLERLLRSASEQQQRLRSLPPPGEQKPIHLNWGDSVGLISLILGVLAVTLTPPVWLKVGLLLAACIGCFVFSFRSHWTYSLNRLFQTFWGVVMCLLIAAIALPQLTSQWKSEHPSMNAIKDSDFYGTVTGWGAQQPGAGLGGEGYMDVNNAKLLAYKEKYKMIVVVRVHNTRVDSLTDPVIQKSNGMTIPDGAGINRITVPFSQEFLRAALAILGPEVEFEMHLCLIPKGADVGTISTLKDIAVKGGHVFQPSYGAGAGLAKPIN